MSRIRRRRGIRLSDDVPLRNPAGKMGLADIVTGVLPSLLTLPA